MKKSMLLYLVIFLLVLPRAFARNKSDTLDSIKGIFYKANAIYSRAEYSKAISEYNKIIDKGWVSGAVFYNLGNCYFKEGKLGKAILNYDKARRIIPRDSDLESNYKYARSLIKGGSGKSVSSWLMSFVNWMFGSFTINELSVILSCIYLAVILIIILSLYYGLIRRYKTTVITVLIVVFIIAFIETRSKISIVGREGVVIVKKADVKFEPFVRATTYLTLYEGTEVKVLSCEGKWSKVKRWDGKTGWVEKNAIENF